MVLKSKRGKTVYLPLVVPETWCLGLAFLLTVIAAILFWVAVGTTTWKQVQIMIPVNSWTNATYEFDFGVRRVHVVWCEKDTYPEVNQKPDSCGGEDVLYTSCGPTNDYCVGASSSDLMFFGVGVGLMGGFCLLSIVAQFVRRYLHFLWHLPVSILSPLVVMMTSFTIDKVQIAQVIARQGNAQAGGYTVSSNGTSFRCAVAAVVLVWVAFLLMLMDLCYQKYLDHKRPQSRSRTTTVTRPSNASSSPSGAGGVSHVAGMDSGSDDQRYNHPHESAATPPAPPAPGSRAYHSPGGI